jgi:hypothetical protein
MTVHPRVVLHRVDSGRTYEFDAGHSKVVPDGTYVVGSYISESSGLTLAARTVRVNRGTAVTFDARQGRRINASIDRKDAKVVGLNAEILVGDSALSTNTSSAIPGRTFAIPSPGGSAVLAVQMVLARAGSGPTPYRYDLVRRTRGIPTDLRLTAKRGDLARVDMTLRRLDPDQRRALMLTAVDARTGKRPFGYGAFGDVAYGSRLVSYRTPGLRWSALYRLIGQAGENSLRHSSTAAYRTGTTYRETWGAGVWTLRSDSIRAAVSGGTLTVSRSSVLCPTERGAVRLHGCSSPTKTVFTLYRDGSVLSQGTRLVVEIPHEPQTYELRMHSTRRKGARLSSIAEGRWSFSADGGTDTRLETGMVTVAAGGLDANNFAARGSTTDLTFSVADVARTTSFALEVSTDGEQTWNAVAVKRSGSRWTAKVRNPSKAGAVSLRTTARSAADRSTQQQITDAYGVR